MVRRYAVGVTLVCGVTFVVAAVFLVPWQWLPGTQVTAAAPETVLTATEIARGERVSALLRHTAWLRLGVSLSVLAVIGFTSLGRRLMGRLKGPWVLRVVIGVVVVLGIVRIATAPLAVRSHRIATREGLSRQAWTGWVRDQLVSYGLEVVLTGLAVLVLVWLVGRARQTWPAWAAGAAAVAVVAGSYAYPLVVEPLFNDFTPMPAGALRDQMMSLATDEGVALQDVLVADASRRTTTLNAYVSGLGDTRRLVVYDTLLDSLPTDEVLVVVAHELGHARHHDVLVGTLLGAAGAGFGVGLLALVLAGRRRRGDPDRATVVLLVPLVVALSAWGPLLGAPVENTISRAIEARADVASLAATGDVDGFVAVQRSLLVRSLADPTPAAWSQFWFGTHPTGLQRVGLARTWQAQQQDH